MLKIHKHILPMIALAGLLLILGTAQTPAFVTDGLPSYVAVANPPDRALHTMIVDRNNDRVVLFGGLGYERRFNDVWTLSHDFWSGQVRWSRAVTGEPEPAPRRSHAAAYDQSRGIMYIFGGDPGDYNYMNDVWCLDLTPGNESWTELETSGTPPSPRVHSTMIYDEQNDRLIVFGGQTQSVWFGDVYELDRMTNQWTELSPAGEAPYKRSMAGGVYIPENQEMWLFGGVTDPFTDFNDLWSLDLTVGQEAWTELAPTGGPPDKRGVGVIDYDRSRGCLLLHAGWSVSGGLTDYNDTWTIGSDLHWNEVETENTIVPRRNSRGVCYSRPERSYLVTFGGAWFPMGETYFGDTHILKLP